MSSRISLSLPAVALSASAYVGVCILSAVYSYMPHNTHNGSQHYIIGDGSE